MIPGVGAMPAALKTESGATDPRLKPAAHEFEACLMKEFLEPLQKDVLFGEGGDDSNSGGSSNALMSFGSEALARALSERGGFGIAAKILDHFGMGKGQTSDVAALQAGKRMKIGLKVL